MSIMCCTFFLLYVFFFFFFKLRWSFIHFKYFCFNETGNFAAQRKPLILKKDNINFLLICTMVSVILKDWSIIYSDGMFQRLFWAAWYNHWCFFSPAKIYCLFWYIVNNVALWYWQPLNANYLYKNIVYKEVTDSFVLVMKSWHT